MNKSASFDPSRKLDLYFRVNRNGNQSFVFSNSDGTSYGLVYHDFQLNISRYAGEKKKIISLTLSSGLSIVGNVLTATITSVNSNVNEGEYYWELYLPDLGQTWLSGTAYFHNNEFDGVEDSTALTIGSTSVSVTVVSGGAIPIPKFTYNPTLVLSGGKTFGKYVNGDTPNWIGLDAIGAILDAIIEYVKPAFTSFTISAQSTIVEVGTTLSGSKTFLWNITVNSGVVSTIDIYDVTAAATLLANTPNDGTQAVTITTKQLNSSGASQAWKGIAHDSGSSPSDISSSNFTVTANYILFYGAASGSATNSALVRALAQSGFVSGGGTLILNTGTTLTKFIIALPPGRTLTAVIDLDAFNVSILASYVSQGNVSVTDAGGTSRTYQVLEMNVGVAYGISHRHQFTFS